MNDELKALEKEAEELRQNLWIWKGIAFVLLVLYVSEIDGWFSWWKPLVFSVAWAGKAPKPTIR